MCSYISWDIFSDKNTRIVACISIICGFAILLIQTVLTGKRIGGLSSENMQIQPDKSFQLSTNSTQDIHNIRPGDQNMTPKVILLWNRFIYRRNWSVEMGNGTFHRLGCQVRNCEITSDRKHLNRSDAILFHSQRLDGDPPSKYPHQRFVFATNESPENSWNSLYSSPQWKHVFNWTITYRLDSDIVLHYGLLEKKESYVPKNLTTLAERVNKRQPVAWMASNCHQPKSRHRDEYVKSLERWITVDKYGLCGDKVCKKKDNEKCLQMLNNSYNFYLAFENSFCKDYVTEKLYKILPLDVIPVVRGGADYLKFIPKHWAINTADFNSTKQLANYLIYLQKNPDEYVKYFMGKDTYSIITYKGCRNRPFWCELCAKLNNPSEPTRYYEDITTWWGKQDCKKPAALH